MQKGAKMTVRHDVPELLRCGRFALPAIAMGDVELNGALCRALYRRGSG